MDNDILNEIFQITPQRLSAVYKYEDVRIDDPGSEFHGAKLPVNNTYEVEKMIRSYNAYVDVRKNYAYRL